MKSKHHLIRLLPLFFLLVVFSVCACQGNIQNKVDMLSAQGDASFENGDYRKALSFWQQALSYNLNQDPLFEKIAGVYLKLADFKSAHNIIFKLIERHPGNSGFLKYGVRINLIIGDIEAAEANMGNLKTAAPDSPDTFEVLGDLMVFRNELQEAKKAYSKCLYLSPNNPVVAVKMAQCLLALNEPDQAEGLLRRALTSTVASSQFLAIVSNYYKLGNNDGLAEHYLLKAAEIDPNNLAVKKELVEFYYEKQKYEKSFFYVQEVLSKEKENKAFQLLLVELLLVQNRFSEARQKLFEAGDEMANDIDAIFLKGKIHLMAGEPLAAIQYFKAVLDIQPSNAVAAYMLSIAYLNNQNNHTAMASLKNLLMLSPQNNDADLLLSNIYYKNEEYSVSRKYAERVAEREPTNYRAHMIIGNCLLAQNRADDAIEFFQKAQKENPNAIEPGYYLALSYEVVGRWQEAFDNYMKIIEMQPLIVDAGFRCVQLAVKYQKIEILYEIILKQRQQQPENGYFDYLLGDLLLGGGKIEEAIIAFENAIRTDPKISSLYLKLSEMYRKRKDNEKRLNILKRAVHFYPDFIQAHIELSDVFRQQGDFEQAAKILESAIDNGLQDPILLNNFADILIELGQYNKAFEIARDAHKNLPNSAFCSDTLGWAYYHKKLYDQAFWYFKEALALENSNAVVHYHFGLTLYEIGKSDEAKHHLQNALEIGLPDRYALKAKEVLAKVK